MNIVIVCSYGLSSGMLAGAIEKEAAQRGLDVTARHMFPRKLKDHMDECDVVLLSPQVRFHADAIRSITDPQGVPVATLSMEVYGRVKGAEALDLALKALEERAAS